MSLRRAALVVVLVLTAAPGCGGDGAPDEAGATAATQELRAPQQLVAELRRGGFVLYFRHAVTDHSERDVAGAPLTNCRTQRNLTEEGRRQARDVGRALRALAIPIGDVVSSEYCRTRETARLAFGRFRLDPDLTGIGEEGGEDYARRVRALRSLLGRPPPRANTVLVGHVKNLEAAAGLEIEEGEIAVFEPRGRGRFRLVGRVPAAVWPQLAEQLGPP